MAKDNLILLGVGDVAPSHEPVEEFSTLARPTLATGDICIGQCERVYTERGSPQVHTHRRKHDKNRLKPHMASVFRYFNVVSLASNHAMDWGDDGLLDTAEVLEKIGSRVIGAGRNIAEARQPAIIEKNGVRVAILAYCSVLREGYAAEPDKAGVAPLRAHTYYEAEQYYAGFPPKVITVPYQEDMAAMVKDIAKAKKDAHAVILVCHWGIHHIPRMIPDYQPIYAEAAFEAGADLILGHHAHVPKAIAVHKGKVCFHSLGNFMTSKSWKEEDSIYADRFGLAVDPDPDFINLSHGHADARRSLIAKAIVSRDGVERVSFLPALIDRKLRPEILLHGDPRFDDAVKYMDWASEGYDHKFVVEGDEVVVTGAWI